MKIEYININEVKLNPDNPRTITKENQEKLINSLLVFPRMLEIRPIVIDDNNIVLGGNQRTEALRAIAKMETTTIRERLNGLNDFRKMSDTEQSQVLSFWEEWKQAAPVIKASELTEEEKKQFIIKDNAPFGEWDWNALESWDAESLQDWGLEVPEDWNTEEEEKQVEEDDYTESDAQSAPQRVKRGEIWQLGEHRLMCGDSTVKEDVEKLMNGEKADLVFTDPPYGIEAVNVQNQVGGGGELKFKGKIGGDKPFGNVGGNNIVKANKYNPIKGDDTTETARLNYEIIKNISNEQIIFGGNYFTEFLPPKPCWIVWDKQNTGNFADVEIAWTSLKKGAKLYRWLWNGLCRKGDRKIEGIRRIHPTQKPVGLIADILNDFTEEKDVILDPFGGSGSTLIACEVTNRKCNMIEYEEYYCDVIINRWEKLTGKEAVKIYG